MAGIPYHPYPTVNSSRSCWIKLRKSRSFISRCLKLVSMLENKISRQGDRIPPPTHTLSRVNSQLVSVPEYAKKWKTVGLLREVRSSGQVNLFVLTLVYINRRISRHCITRLIEYYIIWCACGKKDYSCLWQWNV